jgi:hypothetical protein
MTLVAVSPPEWIPLIICAIILLKAWQSWIERKRWDKDDDDETPKTEAVG